MPYSTVDIGHHHTVMILFVLAAFLAVNGIESRVSPKFLKALGGVQKALYAEQFGYSLIPIPNRILLQAKLAKPVWQISRIGGSRKHVYNYGSRRRRRRRRKRPHRRPSYYGIPTYAQKYKEYIPERRPPWARYKKRQRYRIPHRHIYIEPEEFDYYEQEIPVDEYMEYEPSHGPPQEPEYMEYEGPNKHYSEYDGPNRHYSEYDGPNRHYSEYDDDFMTHHADLYSDGYNSGPPRVRIYDSNSEASALPVTRVKYQHNRQKPGVGVRHNLNMFTPANSYRSRPSGAMNVMVPPRPMMSNVPKNHKSFRPSSPDTRHVGRDVSLHVKNSPNFNWDSDTSSLTYAPAHHNDYSTNSHYYNDNLSRRSEENFDDVSNSEKENNQSKENTQFDYGMGDIKEEITRFL